MSVSLEEVSFESTQDNTFKDTQSCSQRETSCKKDPQNKSCLTKTCGERHSHQQELSEMHESKSRRICRLSLVLGTWPTQSSFRDIHPKVAHFLYDVASSKSFNQKPRECVIHKNKGGTSCTSGKSKKQGSSFSCLRHRPQVSSQRPRATCASLRDFGNNCSFYYEERSQADDKLHKLFSHFVVQEETSQFLVQQQDLFFSRRKLLAKRRQ